MHTCQISPTNTAPLQFTTEFAYLIGYLSSRRAHHDNPQNIISHPQKARNPQHPVGIGSVFGNRYKKDTNCVEKTDSQVERDLYLIRLLYIYDYGTQITVNAIDVSHF